MAKKKRALTVKKKRVNKRRVGVVRHRSRAGTGNHAIENTSVVLDAPFVVKFELNGEVYQQVGETLEDAMLRFKIPQQLIKTVGVVTIEHDGKSAVHVLKGRPIRMFLLNHLNRKITGAKMMPLLR